MAGHVARWTLAASAAAQLLLQLSGAVNVLSSELAAQLDVEETERLLDVSSVLRDDEEGFRDHGESRTLGRERASDLAEDGDLRYDDGRPWRLQAKLTQCEFTHPHPTKQTSPAAEGRGAFTRRETGEGEGSVNVWQRYKDFHQEGVQAIQAGQTRRMVIWRCLTEDHCCGNGDQIRGLLSTFYWAVQNKHMFFMQWERQNFSMSKLLVPSSINWKLPANFTCNGEETVSVMTNDRFRFDREMKAADRTSTCIYVHSTLAPTKQRAELAGLPYRPGCAFHYLFKPSDLLMRTMAKRQEIVTDGAYTAIHLRFGDHQMDPDVQMSKKAASRIHANHEKVLEAALRCARELDADGRLPAVVYSDDVEVKKMAADRSWASEHAAGMRVDSSRGESGELFTPAHTDRLDASGIHPGLVDAWADQFGIAGAARAVMTYSGFSRWAIEIGMLSSQAVRYLKGSHLNCEYSKYNIGKWPIDDDDDHDHEE